MAVLRIAFLGDSMTTGAGDPTMLGWVGRVCAGAWGRGHDVTAYNLGIRRDTSADIHARWREEVAARLPPEHPRALVFCFGVNDCVLEGEAWAIAFALKTLGKKRGYVERIEQTGADGERLAVMMDRASAFSAALAHALEPVSVH